MELKGKEWFFKELTLVWPNASKSGKADLAKRWFIKIQETLLKREVIKVTLLQNH